jgi:hypothetical protein
MKTLPSAQFRVVYAGLRDATRVTVLGHYIGTWMPAAVYPDPETTDRAPTPQPVDAPPVAPKAAPKAVSEAVAAPPKPAPTTRAAGQAKRDEWLHNLNAGGAPTRADRHPTGMN